MASPITPEAQMQIDADNRLAQTIHADEQMGVDRALAQQLQESHSITVPRQWLQNGQPSESRDIPGARSSNYIGLPDANHPAEHHQLLPGNNRRRRRTNNRSRSEPPITKIGHRQQLRLFLKAVFQFNYPLALTSQLLGTSLSNLTRKQRKEQLDQGHLINVVLGYALNSNYSVSMYCAYLVLSEMNFNSKVLNLRHAGKTDGEHPITGMLRYFALIKRARPQKSDGTLELPYHEFRYMEAILTKVATDQQIYFPNCDPQDLALHDDGIPPIEPHRLPSPCKFADAQSDSDNSDEDTRISTDEVEDPSPSSRQPDSATTEWPVMNEERAKVIDQGIDVHFYAPKSSARPKVFDHMNISDLERENFLKTCPKRLLRCLGHEVAGCNFAMQPGGWVPVSEAVRGLSEEFRDHNSQNHKDPLCMLGYGNQGILTDSNESYPRTQFKCVMKGYLPDNPETPDVMDNTLILNLRQIIPFYGYSKDPYVITHMRAGHGMTRKEIRSARVPNRVWYTTDNTPVKRDTVQSCSFFENTYKLKIPYAGSKLPSQDINFDMTNYVVHWTKAASFAILLATGLVDNGWKIPETGYNLSEVKSEILFHRVAVNHNQLTNSPQYV